MFATGEVFSYFCCGVCGCLQLEQIPADLSSYYPASYYSYQQGKAEGWRIAMRQRRNRELLQGYGLLAKLQPYEALNALARLKPARSLRILDVGCGQGQLINGLRELGYHQTLGIDPFLNQDISPWLRKLSLQELEGQWDIIMLHHSLEHLPDIHAAFKELTRLLAPAGRLLIRVPTVDSQAYQDYGPDWVQWDPPRHLYLFARENFQRLAQTHGLKLNQIWDDSTALQFWGSERYRRGLALAGASRSERFNPFYHYRAQQLNRQSKGDQIVCLLSR